MKKRKILKAIRSHPRWQLFREFGHTLHTPEYLAAKAQDFGAFTFWALLVTAVFILFTMLWDHAIDPVNAGRTVSQRLLECAAVLSWALASRRNVHSRLARLSAWIAPLFVEASFIVVLATLERGPSHGIGGFLYLFIFMPFLLLAQSIRLAVSILASITLFPMLAAQFGLSAGLDWHVYSAYMMIGFPPVVAILLFFESLYWNLYRSRLTMESQARTDGLTHLPNRRHFLNEGAHSLAQHRLMGEPASLLFIDIDHFKSINDTYGHRIGDLAIDHLARLLSQCSRDDDLLARYGGEEFLILLPRTGPSQAQAMAERMRQYVVDTPLVISGDAIPLPLTLTISIGVANYDAISGVIPDIEVLIHAADQAVYDAKRQGRNRVVLVSACDDAGDRSLATPAM